MPTKFPQKIRDMHSHHFDSTIWDDLSFRDDDIIISSYGKSGTTWIQQIIAQLLYDGSEDLEVSDMSLWMDLRVPPKELKLSMVEAQTHRRFMKTHLPVDALRFSPKAKYVYIARDGRDVLWSFYNHHSKANKIWYEALNNTPGRVGPPIDIPPIDIVQYYQDWIEGDGFPYWSFWDNIRTWWEIRDLPNVLFLHYNNVKEDTPGEIRRIASFLDIDINEENWQKILKHCSFDYMKANAIKCAPLRGKFWDGGAQVFIHKGQNGRWRDTLTEEDITKYENLAVEKLGKDCAHWLATGYNRGAEE